MKWFRKFEEFRQIPFTDETEIEIKKDEKKDQTWIDNKGVVHIKNWKVY